MVAEISTRLMVDTQPINGSQHTYAQLSSRARARRRLRKIDGRTKPGRFLRRIERELTEHLGGPQRISTPQRLLIERTAVDLLRLELLDTEMATGTFSEHDGRVAHALRNSVRLLLRELGIEQPVAAAPSSTLDDHLRTLAEGQGTEAAE
jgi:hypothetical protein